MRVAISVAALVLYVQVIMTMAEPKNTLLRATTLASSTVLAALAIIFLLGFAK